MFASDYPLFGVFISTCVLAGFLFWLLLVVHILHDIFRSRDLGGAARASWVLFILVVPLLGCLIFLVARGGTMHERRSQELHVQHQALEDYIRHVANTKE